MIDKYAKFRPGQIVHHRLFDYRGVIIDVDPHYDGSEAWYEAMAQSEPPKDRPWYHILVHDAAHRTYVAEQNLEIDGSDTPIRHPELIDEFVDFEDGAYTSRHLLN